MAIEGKYSLRVDNYYIAEVFTTKGPETIGDTQDQTYEQLYGYDWVVTLNSAGLLNFYQWQTNDFVEVTGGLPTFLIIPTARRISLAFDQAARACIAYELSGVIYIVKWDIGTNSYVVNNTFEGAHPILFNDVIVNKFVGDSDIICFYVKGQSIKQRFQRDDYGAEETLTLDDLFYDGVIIDRVRTSRNKFLKWQILASDADGEPLGLMPTSDLYPYHAALTAVEGDFSFFAELDSLVIQYYTNLQISGDFSFLAALRSIVQTYTTELTTLEGNFSFSALLDTIVQTYTTELNTLEGNFEFTSEIETIAEAYLTNLNTLTGDFSFSAVLTTV